MDFLIQIGFTEMDISLHEALTTCIYGCYIRYAIFRCSKNLTFSIQIINNLSFENIIFIHVDPSLGSTFTFIVKVLIPAK